MRKHEIHRVIAAALIAASTGVMAACALYPNHYGAYIAYIASVFGTVVSLSMLRIASVLLEKISCLNPADDYIAELDWEDRQAREALEMSRYTAARLTCELYEQPKNDLLDHDPARKKS